jgi:SAM-dependent methyltransferase
VDNSFYDIYWNKRVESGQKWGEQQFNKVLGPLRGLGKVLDYGCGLGLNYQRSLAASTNDYVGADISENALKDAASKGYHTLKIGQNGQVNADSESFDGAVCSEVFEHLFDPLSAAREIHRVIKPGGVLVATVPNFGYLAWRLQALFRARVPSEPENPKANFFNGVHIRYFNKATFSRLLKDAGFVDVRVGSFDNSSIWDIFWAFSYMGYISQFARDYLPPFFQMRFLQNLVPSLFAYRLRAVGRKKSLTEKRMI